MGQMMDFQNSNSNTVLTRIDDGDRTIIIEDNDTKWRQQTEDADRGRCHMLLMRK